MSGRVVNMMRTFRIAPVGMPADIPWAVALAPTQDKKLMMRLLTAASDIGRPFITRRDVPPDRLATLRTAFNNALKDPALIAEADKTGRPVSPMTAEEVMEALEELYAIPKEIVAKTKASLSSAHK